MFTASFRNWFSAGLLLAVLTAVYLSRLWQGEKQVRLHNEHFLHAIEQKAWAKAGAFIDEQYQDQWGQNRAVVRARLREVLPYMRNPANPFGGTGDRGEGERWNLARPHHSRS